MCLGTVAKVVEMQADARAIVEHAAGEHGAGEHGAVEHAGRREVVLDMTDAQIAPGDWVVIHSGFALERISEAQAIDALAIRATPAASAASQNREVAP